MASIFERKNKDGTSTFRVQIRRNDRPLLCLSFSSYDEAQKWVREHEYLYIQYPECYQKWIQQERLNLQRKREFHVG